MGFFDKLRSKLEIGDGKERKNRMMTTESNRDQLHSTHSDAVHNEEYDEPRNRMMDTISNAQLGSELRGDSPGLENKNQLENTLSNAQVKEYARGEDPNEILSSEPRRTGSGRTNELFEASPNDNGDIEGLSGAGGEQLNSNRVL